MKIRGTRIYIPRIFTSIFLLLTAPLHASGHRFEDSLLCEDGMTVRQISEYFEEIAFGEVGDVPGDVALDKTRKWVSPMAFWFYFRERLDDRTIEKVMKPIGWYAAVSGHAVTIAEDPPSLTSKKSHVAVYFADSVELYEELVNQLQSHPDSTPATQSLVATLKSSLRFERDNLEAGEGCFYAKTYRKQDNSINGAVIIVPIWGNYARQCMSAALFSVMGLGNVSETHKNSIFYSTEKQFQLGESEDPEAIDLMLLRLLYDNRMKTGMTKVQAAPVVRRVLADICPRMPDG